MRTQPLQLPCLRFSAQGANEALVSHWSFLLPLLWSLGASSAPSCPAPCWAHGGMSALTPGSGILSSCALTSLLSLKKRRLNSDLRISLHDPIGAELGSQRSSRMCPIKHRPISFCFLQPCLFCVTSPHSKHCRVGISSHLDTGASLLT